MVRGVTDADGRDDVRGVLSRESFGSWLPRSLDQERAPKTASLGSISERHMEAMADIRRELLRRGYSRRQSSNTNLIETAIELLYAHVFRRRIP